MSFERLRSGALTASGAHLDALDASRTCCVVVLASNAKQDAPDARLIERLARHLAEKPMDTQLNSDWTCLNVLAKHAKQHRGAITRPEFADALANLAERHGCVS